MDDIARERLDAEDKLHLKAADTLHRELLQELDRFPLVERAVADVPALANPEFAAGIRRHAQNLLQRSRGISVEGDVSRPNNYPVTRDRDERERRTGESLHEEPASRGNESMKTEDRA